MSEPVSLEWLGKELRKSRDSHDYEPEEYPPYTVDSVADYLCDKLPKEAGEELMKAYRGDWIG